MIKDDNLYVVTVLNGYNQVPHTFFINITDLLDPKLVMRFSVLKVSFSENSQNLDIFKT